jgi:hypothetical protein
MRRTLIAIHLVSMFVSLAGCRRYSASVDNSRATGLSAIADGEPMTASYKMAAIQLMAGPPETKHFIAVRHKLIVVSPESDLPRNWEAVINCCGTIRCEVVSSSIVTRTQVSSPSGAIALRVIPEDFSKLLTQVQKQGSVVEHTTQSEDKTTEVVDTEARPKNLTAYRDGLRAMLGRPGLNIKDSVEIQEKLTDVQSNLDSEAANGKFSRTKPKRLQWKLNSGYAMRAAGAARSPLCGRP